MSDNNVSSTKETSCSARFSTSPLGKIDFRSLRIVWRSFDVQETYVKQMKKRLGRMSWRARGMQDSNIEVNRHTFLYTPSPYPPLLPAIPRISQLISKPCPLLGKMSHHCSLHIKPPIQLRSFASCTTQSRNRAEHSPKGIHMKKHKSTQS